MSRSRRVLYGTLLLAAVLTLVWAVHPHVLRAMARWLDVGGRPQPAEYVMVLTGGENTRPFAAATLLRAGFAPCTLVTQVAVLPELTKLGLPPSHEINRRVLLNRGIAPDDIIVLPASATTTHDEAVALAAFLADRPKARVLVVTNDCHTRRSRWVFARVLGDRAGQVSFVSAPTDEFSMDCWWQDEAGFVTIVSEYLKLAFYLVCYGHFGSWLAACGGLALVASWIPTTAARGMKWYV